jgi:hypothetical protein
MSAKAKKYADGGAARGNAGGAMRGRERAAEMSGRSMPARPDQSASGIARAAQMSGRAFNNGGMVRTMDEGMARASAMSGRGMPTPGAGQALPPQAGGAMPPQAGMAPQAGSPPVQTGLARAAEMSGRAFADGGYVCGHTSGLHGKNMKKGSK